jgi:hypothetical protein
MYMVRIEHAVPDFEGWRRAFDSDPAGRERAGVKRYQVLRASEDRNYVFIDLEFASMSEAEAFLTTMREVWGRVEGTVMTGPQARIVEVLETKDY